ncbi:MAG TPA: isochorismate synthase [Actinomycetota bacterium]|nr:isochorismate synthase [Actinomycetota bacterium]
MATLVARPRRLGPAFDLLANYRPGGFFFERAGIGVSAVGMAERIGVEGGPERLSILAREAQTVLRDIRVQGGGSPPIAVGAIPFDAGWPAHLVVPERTAIRRSPGATEQLDVFPEGFAPLNPERERWTGRALPHDAFEDMHLRPDPEPEEYAHAVREATRRIRAGRLRKVVLARSIVVAADRALDPKQLLWRLRAVDPDCWTFATPELALDAGTLVPTGVLVGATPELLVAKRGAEVRSTPLAGSAPRFGDPEADRASARGLFGSAKDREEHALVVEDVAEALRPLCEDLRFPHEPELLGTANVWHLATPFRGTLRSEVRTALDLVAALHPTPAVCGTPRDTARSVLADLEPLDRGCYAGPVGWVDAGGDGEWAIALRCAEITGTTARVFAGAGIVADSDPERELDETDRKFRALLDSLRWG